MPLLKVVAADRRIQFPEPGVDASALMTWLARLPKVVGHRPEEDPHDDEGCDEPASRHVCSTGLKCDCLPLTMRVSDPAPLTSDAKQQRGRGVRCMRLGAPDMGVNWKGGSPFVWEHGCPAVLHGQQDGVNTRARQLPDREVWWEGSLTQT